MSPYSSTSSSSPLHASLIESMLTADPSAPFVTMWHSEDQIESITFGTFARRAAGQASFLREAGLARGERVVLVMPQGIELMASFVGAMMLGAVPAILAYPNFKVDPAKYRAGLEGVTRNLKPHVILTDYGFPDEMREHVRTDGALILGGPGTREEDPGNVRTLDGLPEDLAFIQHSAGTTGLQKGVALSHEAVQRQLGRLSDALQISPDDRIYSWLPLYHDMGLIACFMLPVTRHIPLVMQSPTTWVMQPSSMVELMSRFRCTLTWVPNFALQFLARRIHAEDIPDYDLSCVRAIINCSEPVRAKSIDEFMDVFGSCGLRPKPPARLTRWLKTSSPCRSPPYAGRNDPCVFLPIRSFCATNTASNRRPTSRGQPSSSRRERASRGMMSASERGAGS